MGSAVRVGRLPVRLAVSLLLCASAAPAAAQDGPLVEELDDTYTVYAIAGSTPPP